ncbi:expressed unknown protein [Seminavis robusta]|uniref:Helicase-associated domain-containing protein n=1 Tax=Seminavis robusta TaxID=568900 RepID=A0A9N8DN47_9STRA|nr:expressed unknown protein [Seminavis robusta]|eukprot:Sro147_g067880.1 n/a (217) ;mRNA; f:60898-61644
MAFFVSRAALVAVVLISQSCSIHAWRSGLAPGVSPMSKGSIRRRISGAGSHVKVLASLTQRDSFPSDLLLLETPNGDFWTPSVQATHLMQQENTALHSPKQTRKDEKKSKFTWEQKFALLRQYKKEHGNCNPPANYVVNGVKLGGWVATQRKEYWKHQAGLFSMIINQRRIHRLERVGFQWEPDLEVVGADCVAKACKALGAAAFASTGLIPAFAH